MTDGINHVGVGMTMTRINENGIPEPIKDHKIEKRVNWILTRDVAALQRAHDAWMAQAERERQKCERTRVPGSRHKMKYMKSNECLQMAHSYRAVIERIQEESA